MQKWVEYDVNDLIEKCNLSIDSIKYVENKLNISMKDFYDDYCENRYTLLDNERQKLLNQLFVDASTQPFINSVRARVKDLYHLLGKGDVIMIINKQQGTIAERAARMTSDVVEGRKKQHILMNSAVPRVKKRDLELNRYKELLDHPFFSCVFTVKGDFIDGIY